MIYSMTAFARQEIQESWGQLCWELRSVNHRYLDISIRLADEFRPLEGVIREYLQQRLRRGKIEIILYFQPSQEAKLTINVTLVQQLWELVKTLPAITGGLSPPTALDWLRWPGVLETSILASEQIRATIWQHFEMAVNQLMVQREREGGQLAELIEQRCVAIATHMLQIRQELPLILQAQRERLESRLAELKEINRDRLEQELVILAQKMDVAEELDRMDAHLEEIRRILKEPQVAIGRKLEFLVQELHREANTLGAKANHIHTSRQAIEIKVFIEQMREQTQNIE